ncbi:uncharacterized protein LOC119741428 [Patiria miniata]|uniref:Death domain-containing protein n=1 Tax=Patiria miniata TaxID=46514 RepID=A0A914BCE0_PATMI|nr:uncharacterized protein LOC119741428 [Patiria miniata]
MNVRMMRELNVTLDWLNLRIHEPTDTNIFQKGKKAIDRVLRFLTKCGVKIVSIYRTFTTSSKGSESTDDKASRSSEGSGSTDVKASRFSSILKIIKEACTGLESGLIFVIDDEVCIWDIQELWEQRQNRELTPKEFLEMVYEEATKELTKNGLQTAEQFAGKVAGQIAGTYLTKQTGVGNIIAGMLGGFVDGFVGERVEFNSNECRPPRETVAMASRYIDQGMISSRFTDVMSFGYFIRLDTVDNYFFIRGRREGRRVLNDKFLGSIADALDEEWPLLAIELGFDWDECEAIIEAYKGQVKEQAEYMLAAWRQRPDASHLNDLKVALKMIRRCDVLKKIGLEVLDEECLGNLAKSLGRTWTRLAIFLGFDEEDSRRTGNGLNMLKTWKEHYYGNDIVDDLTGALKQIGRYDLLHELGAEDLDTEILNKIGTSLGASWQKLACYLGFDCEDLRDIKAMAGLSSPADQARLMLRIWRDNFEGDNPVQYLATALTLAGHESITQSFEPISPVPAPSPKKSGNVQKCKMVINKALSGLKKGAKMVGRACGILKTSIKDSASTDDSASLVDTLDTIGDVCQGVNTGLILVIDGVSCVWDIAELWQQRKQGNISLKDFLTEACMASSQALVKAGCAVGLGFAGKAIGASIGSVAGSFIAPVIGTWVGGYIGAIVGGAVGLGMGWVVGKLIGKMVNSAIKYDDKVVTKVSALRPGDQIILPGTWQLPKRHAIVLDVFDAKEQIGVICHRSGVVVEEIVPFSPINRIEYDSKECRSSVEVVKRARSKIGEELPQKANDGSEFAQWCKLDCVVCMDP